MCSSKQVCNGELPLLHHNGGNYRKPSLTNTISGQNLAWWPPLFIALLKTTQNFLQGGSLIFQKSTWENYGLNLYLSIRRNILCKFNDDSLMDQNGKTLTHLSTQIDSQSHFWSVSNAIKKFETLLKNW